jgi:hypothetical protein
MNFRVPLALLVVVLAILGALLHPLALALAPFHAGGVVAFLVELRSTIADLLGWGLLSLIAVMAAFVVWGRLKRHREAAAEQAALRRASKATLPRVVVALTAYNDAEATAQAVKDFRRQPGVMRVIVIDNNSTDQTSELAGAAGATVIREKRQGYGYACIRGLAEGLKVPDADVVVLAEGDGTFVAEDTAKFLAYIGDADLVVGNRVVRDLVDTDSQMDHFFTWGNMAVAMLLRLRFWDGRFLGPAGLTDVGCTFRAIQRQALERLLPDLVVGDSHFSIHMLLVAMARGLSVIEIPVRLRRRVGQSKGASQSLGKGFAIGLAMIWHIMTFRLEPAPPASDVPSQPSPQSNGQPGAAASTQADRPSAANTGIVR